MLLELVVDEVVDVLVLELPVDVVVAVLVVKVLLPRSYSLLLFLTVCKLGAL